MKFALSLLAGFLLSVVGASADGFHCAGYSLKPGGEWIGEVAAKPVRSITSGSRRALVIFARFADGEEAPVPSWAADIFAPDRPGSVAHFYDTMSFGQLRVRGESGTRRYASRQPASAYLADTPYGTGGFGRFVLEVLEQADAEIDLGGFDSDGPDGIPDSGDDDGFVDALFVVVAATPRNFILGGATGVGYLGLDDEGLEDDPQLDEGDFISGDMGNDGRPIRMASRLGTVQLEDGFAGTVGAMCHEYGHVLGLPDLYNTDFLQAKGVGPEEDSAGIGDWGLMGWGADGWRGNDGPASFCAWSRERLGWAEVVEIGQGQEEMRLQPVARSGQVFEIPLTGREYFLLEYRRWQDSYYDRNIPAEGVLIWHMEQRIRTLEDPSPIALDLECADGRWQDAGYPLGRESDPLGGGDNLDFWAHDLEYARQHGGNLGDATDIFDGVRFAAFTPETNPGAFSNDGRLSMRVENIRLTEGLAIADVEVTPLSLEVEDLSIKDISGDGYLVSGEEAQVVFGLRNQGGLAAKDVRVELQTADSLVQILHTGTRFRDLVPGERSLLLGSGEVFPGFRVRGGFTGMHAAQLFLGVYANGILAGLQEFEVTAVSPRQEILEIAVIDSLGNGDGRLQGGEFFHLSLTLAVDDTLVPQLLRFGLRSLDTGVTQLGDPRVEFQLSQTERSGYVLHSRRAPEFLVPAAVGPGKQLAFELEADNQFDIWRDTLRVEVAEGGDTTPPRVGELSVRRQAAGLEIFLPGEQVLDGGEIGGAQAVIYRTEDTSMVAAVPLHPEDGLYRGMWAAPPGRYLLAGVVDDADGNRGYSPLQEVVVPERPTVLERGVWERLEFQAKSSPQGVLDLAIAPGDPEVMYALTRQSLLRSEDGGANWRETGLMHGFPFGYTGQGEIEVDSFDPWLVYLSFRRTILYMRNSLQVVVYSELLRSRDGGQNWEEVVLPDEGIDVELLAVGPGRGGSLFVRSQGELVVSDDGGESWRRTGIDLLGGPFFAQVHPAQPPTVYAGWLQVWDGNVYRPEILYRSDDSGTTWQSWPLDHLFSTLSLDPQNPDGLFATYQRSIWRSLDRGMSWEQIAEISGGSVGGIVAHPLQPDLLFAPLSAGSFRFWRSDDGGHTWQLRNLPAERLVTEIVPSLRDSQEIFLLFGSSFLQEDLPVFISRDSGDSWRELPIPPASPPVEVLAIDQSGRLFAGSAGWVKGGSTASDPPARSSDGEGFEHPMLFTSLDGGNSWNTLVLRPENSSVWYRSPDKTVVALHVDPARPEVIISLARSPFGEIAYLRSEDQGKTWDLLSVGQPGGSAGPLQTHPQVVGDPRRRGVYYIADYNLYRSADFGVTWEKCGLDLSDWFLALRGFALVPGDTTTLYAAVDDRIWRSRDEGESWEDSGPVASGETVLDLAVDPLDASRLYASTTGGLYASDIRTGSWSLLRRAESGMWTSSRIRFSPHESGTIYLVNGNRLLESVDGGRMWESLGEEFGGWPWFSDVAVDPFAPSTLYAATPRGVFRLVRNSAGTAVSEPHSLPAELSLAQNYPNPFNAQTIIEYRLSETERVRLAIYNIIGQKVGTLVDEVQAAGAHRISWDGTDEAGRAVSSGVYFYRLTAEGQLRTRRMALIR